MLPSYRKGAEKPKTSRQYFSFVFRRYGLLLLVSIALIVIFGRGFASDDDYLEHLPPQFYASRGKSTLPPPLPPLYSNHHRELLNLPQHHWSQTTPAANEKFFYVAGHARNTGWGNAMEELLLNAYIAYRAGRSFVFGNYTWNPDGSLYSDFNGKKIPSQIPYSVIMRGPIVGGSFPAGDYSPLAVSRSYYEQICPDPLIFIREEVHDHLSNGNNAKQITDGWVSKLTSNDNPCIQSAAESGQLFNYMVFGDRAAMWDIWPEFSTSPMMTHFSWSPLVELGFDVNRELFFSGALSELYLSSRPFTTNAERYTMIPGLLAMHIRRGDFEEHCEHLARWSSDFLAFTSFPDLPDKFVVPPHEEWGTNTPENHALYRRRCFPSVEQIVDKVRAVRTTPAGRGIKKVFVMTNGSPEWIVQLKLALLNEEGLPAASSRDLVLNLEQKYVAQAVDMLVGQRAQVLIGNGFSTMTSNMVMMRMANHFTPESTRFF